ncbi:MAG: site-specific tyrosine recombinase/integron integrase [Mycoplasmatales bacterium]
MILSNERLLNEFLRHLQVELDYSNNTINSYKLDIKQYFKLIDKALKDITKDDIASYLAYFNENFTTATYSRKISSLKSFYKFLNEEYQILNLFETIQIPKGEKKLPQYFTQQELFKLLDSIENKTKIDIRDKAMLELLYCSGMRISELLNLEEKDLKLTEKFVIVIGKGSKQRMIPINDHAIQALKNYLKIKIEFLHIPNNTLFVNAQGRKMTRQGFTKILKTRAKLVGINDISAHKLRHSIATHLLQNGANLKAIQQLLGHENITTTEIYTHVNKQQLQAEYNKYFTKKIISKGE